MNNKSFLTYLTAEYEHRRNKNSLYSLRSFARLIEVDQSILSKVLRGERNLSWKSIYQCLNKLNASEETLAHFKNLEQITQGEYNELETSQISATGNWKIWAILEYLKIDNTPSSKQLAQHFNLEVNEVDMLIEQLKYLGFIGVKGKRYILLRPNNSWVDTKETSVQRKRLQSDLLEISQKALHKFDMNDRYHGSLTVAVGKKHLPKIKKKLQKFQEDIGNFIQKNTELDDVYQLSLSFFPLTNIEEKHDV